MILAKILNGLSHIYTHFRITCTSTPFDRSALILSRVPWVLLFLSSFLPVQVRASSWTNQAGHARLRASAAKLACTHVPSTCVLLEFSLLPKFRAKRAITQIRRFDSSDAAPWHSRKYRLN
jgi:hypothetical protein